MKIILALSLALTGSAALSTSFAGPAAQEARNKGGQTVLIHRPKHSHGYRYHYQTDRACQNFLDWRCDTPNG